MGLPTAEYKPGNGLFFVCRVFEVPKPAEVYVRVRVRVRARVRVRVRV